MTLKYEIMIWSILEANRDSFSSWNIVYDVFVQTIIIKHIKKWLITTKRKSNSNKMAILGRYNEGKILLRDVVQ